MGVLRRTMLSFRPFRNTDPPRIVELWRSQAGRPGLLQPVSVDLLEQYVLGKLYFDYSGLILALDEDEAVGFAHAGFGPSETDFRLGHEMGTTCLVMIRPDRNDIPVIADGLIQRCEAYLVGRGAKVLYGGGIQPLNAFYLGLYGGSELPGVLGGDTVTRQALEARGYRQIDTTTILHRPLEGFRPPVDRKQMQIRRGMFLAVVNDPPTRTWWEACTLADFELIRCTLAPQRDAPPVASATFRRMEPTAAYGAGRAVGLMELQVHPTYRRQGLATFLLGEASRAFLREGVELVEVQTMCHNTAALGLYKKLGFEPVDEGIVYRKEHGRPAAE